jgi:hypothetical protein
MTTDVLKFDPGRTHGAPGLYLTGEDSLRLTTFGALVGATVVVQGRIITPEGALTPFAETHIPNSDRTSKTSVYPLREGFLTTAHLAAGGTLALRGHIFAILEIVRGRDGAIQPLGTLLSDYVTSNGRVAWPGAPIVSCASGPGRLRTIHGADPAAGAEITEIVPANTRWKIRTFNYTLVTSAAVANRRPVLTFATSGDVIWETASNIAQTATQAAKYRAGVGVPFFLYDTLAYHLPLPCDLWLAAGAVISTVTAALDAGDNYGPPLYTVEEWIEP